MITFSREAEARAAALVRVWAEGKETLLLERWSKEAEEFAVPASEADSLADAFKKVTSIVRSDMPEGIGGDDAHYLGAKIVGIADDRGVTDATLAIFFSLLCSVADELKLTRLRGRPMHSRSSH
jgi:hypothetical protein